MWNDKKISTFDVNLVFVLANGSSRKSLDLHVW